MNEFINQLILFFNQYLSNKKDISENIIQYNCIICGQSKSNKPHMRIDYNIGLYFCYRCNEGGSVYNLLKEFKNSSNKEFVNSLLLLCKKNYNNNYKKNILIKQQFKYTDESISSNNLTIEKDSIAFTFAKYRLGINEDQNIFELLKRFKINCDGNSLYFYGFYNKYKYGYSIINNNEYSKYKKVNNNFSYNDKLDYYYIINNYLNDNLFISESMFDLITIYIINPFYNNDKSNYLSLCSKNYKNIFNFLLSSGKFYYKNIYVLLDNDINKNAFISNIIKILSNKMSNNKFSLFENLYIINADKEYTDINGQYILNNYKIKNLNIKKIK